MDDFHGAFVGVGGEEAFELDDEGEGGVFGIVFEFLFGDPDVFEVFVGFKGFDQAGRCLRGLSPLFPGVRRG